MELKFREGMENAPEYLCKAFEKKKIKVCLGLLLKY